MQHPKTDLSYPASCRAPMDEPGPPEFPATGRQAKATATALALKTTVRLVFIGLAPFTAWRDFSVASLAGWPMSDPDDHLPAYRRGATDTVTAAKRQEPPTLRVLDLFAGCGGFSLGFKSAGFKVVGAVERDPAAWATHTCNLFPGSVLDSVDITQVDAADVRRLRPRGFRDLGLIVYE